MVCRLCLLESSDSFVIFTENKIHQYISKFLHLELTPEDPVSKVICSLCWQQLDNFQSFCLRIEEAQKFLITKQEELKNESSLNAPVQDLPFEHQDFLKEEDLAPKSDDDSIDNSDGFQYLDKETLKTELSNDDLTEFIVCKPTKCNEATVTRRITRGAKRKSDSTLGKEILTDENIKEDAQEQNTIEYDGTANIKIKPEITAKKGRGRPKKGEEKPKVQKIRSAKSEKILETAKEFDEIIQKNMNLTCNVCTVNLIDFAELKRHFRAIHNRKGYAVCCNKRLYKRGLVVDHINTHNNPEYFKCSECGKVMSDRMCLRNHTLLMHQNEEAKTFKCPYCPKKYAKQYLLDHHQVKHVPQEECTFICEECDRGFPTKTTLTKHINQIHSTIYDKMCEICAKLLRGKAAFERHMEEHDGIVRPQVQCETCGSWLKDKNSLRKHMYKHDGKSYSCNECGKQAPSKSALQSHHRYVHQTQRQFHCTFCDKSFKKAVNLREHLTTHTGEVLYTCPHCPKTFNSKANMHAHRKKKHRAEWEANRRYNVKHATSTETNAVQS